MMIFAILVGILYLQTNRREFNRQTVVTDRIGALFFIVLNTVFGNLSAIEVFIRQKAIFVWVIQMKRKNYMSNSEQI